MSDYQGVNVTVELAVIGGLKCTKIKKIELTKNVCGDFVDFYILFSLCAKLSVDVKGSFNVALF